MPPPASGPRPRFPGQRRSSEAHRSHRREGRKGPRGDPTRMARLWPRLVCNNLWAFKELGPLHPLLHGTASAEARRSSSRPDPQAPWRPGRSPSRSPGLLGLCGSIFGSAVWPRCESRRRSGRRRFLDYARKYGTVTPKISPTTRLPCGKEPPGLWRSPPQAPRRFRIPSGGWAQTRPLAFGRR
jgi:hypothetical protein